MNARRGFALVAVLILVGVVALLGASYARHVTLANRSSPATVASMRASGEVESGLQYARQLLRTRGTAANASLADGGTLAVSALGGAHSRLALGSVDDRGIGSTLLFEVERAPLLPAASPDALPRLRAEVVAALLADPALPKTMVSGLTTIQNADLEGLVVVRTGAVLTVSGVCVHGAIVSEQTLTSLDYGPYDVLDAPTLLVAGDLRIVPRAELPGIALVLPDGNVTTTVPGARLQLEGDAVAYSVILSGTGALRGNLATVVAPSLAAALQRPGIGRAPRAWATAFDLGDTSEILSLAAVPRVQTPADVPAILGFDFDDP